MHASPQAPAHELSRYIHIINMLAREASAEKNPVGASLWTLLDELIEVHNRIPRCLQHTHIPAHRHHPSADAIFRHATKQSARRVGMELNALMPALAARLTQRQYDFMLIRPQLKRCHSRGSRACLTTAARC